MFTLCLTALMAMAQERKVQNKPYTDLRPLHLGILVGMNLQDIELENVGPQSILQEDGTMKTQTIVCDDDKWNAGFSVGVLADLRLSQHLNLRFTPHGVEIRCRRNVGFGGGEYCLIGYKE